MVKLMDIPKPFGRITGESGNAHELMNNFFINTKEYIQSKLNDNDVNNFKIEGGYLVSSPSEVISDNIINYLTFREKYVVATMFETRTEFNYLQFTFFRDLSCLEELLDSK